MANSKKYSYKKRSIGFMVLTIILAIGCTEYQNLQQGFLVGTVTIGPLCPVETDPPEPNCQPTEETYNAWPIDILTADGNTVIGQIQPNLDGTYTFELPEGTYQVDLENPHPFGSTLPATVTILANENTVLDIDIDTGIR